MGDVALLSLLSVVERALEQAQRQINSAQAARLTVTEIDCRLMTVEAIEALERALRGRGYRVSRSAGRTYGRVVPLLRVSWVLADPQLSLF